MPNNAISSTTQIYLDIYDITNDVLILKNGSTSLIIQVNAMNFGLLAEPEQDAIIYAYAGLLNSLNYPVQIVIRSQTKDVTNYLNLLKEEEDTATSEVKRNWIGRYREFVAELIHERNVLDKKFYIVIPASALEMGLLPPSTVIPGVKQPDLSTIERSVILEKAKEILEPKRDHFLAQLGRIGLVGRQLTTQEIIQLFYLNYNPEAAEGQQITDTSSYTTPAVQASIQGGLMDNATPAATAATPTPNQQPVAPTAGPVTASTPASAPEPEASMQPEIPQIPPTPAPMPMPPMAAADATATNMPLTTPATPATPTATGTPSIAESPSITPPPGASITPATPGTPDTSSDNATPEAEAQDAINSTLKELGGSGATTPNSATPKAPSMPGSNNPAGSGTPIPNNPPAPPQTPVAESSATPAGAVLTSNGIGTGTSSATTNPSAGGDAMPPLPEI